MTIYKCEKCNFIDENKALYQRHLKTTKHKRNMGEIENVKSIPKVSKEYHSSIPKVSQDDILYECEYCDATFKHNNNKYRHQKYSCKARINQERILQEMKENHRLELIQRDKRIDDLSKKLDKAMERIGNITNNNTVNNNNHSRNLNITINAYGNEDISYLKDGDWLKMLTNPKDSIVNLFLETHFNPEHPENTNIRLRNRNSKFLEVHDGDNWKNKVKKKMLNEIADDKQGILDDKFARSDDIQNTMSDKQKVNHEVYHDETYCDDRKEIVDEIEGILMDNN